MMMRRVRQLVTLTHLIILTDKSTDKNPYAKNCLMHQFTTLSTALLHALAKSDWVLLAINPNPNWRAWAALAHAFVVAGGEEESVWSPREERDQNEISLPRRAIFIEAACRVLCMLVEYIHIYWLTTLQDHDHHDQTRARPISWRWGERSSLSISHSTGTGEEALTTCL